MTDPTRVPIPTTLSSRAALTLQRRLYDLWPSLLMDAVEISEQAGPSGRLEEVLALLQAAEAAVRTAIAASALSGKDS
jgi:hypothetical protein